MDRRDHLHVLPEGGGTSDGSSEGGNTSDGSSEGGDTYDGHHDSDTYDGPPDGDDYGTWTPPEYKVGATSHHIAALRKAPTVSLGTPAYYMICETVTITCSQGNHQVILLYDRGSNDSRINSSFECCMPSHHKVVTLKLMETEMRVTCSQVPTLSKPFSVRSNYNAVTSIVGENLDHLPTIIESLHLDKIYVGMDNGLLMPHRLHEHEIPPHLRHLSDFGLVLHRSAVTQRLLYGGGYQSDTMVDCTELPILLVKNRREVRTHKQGEDAVLPPDEVRGDTEEGRPSTGTSLPTSASLAILSSELDGGVHPAELVGQEGQVVNLNLPTSLASTPAPPLVQVERVENLDDVPDAVGVHQKAGHVVKGSRFAMDCPLKDEEIFSSDDEDSDSEGGFPQVAAYKSREPCSLSYSSHSSLPTSTTPSSCGSSPLLGGLDTMEHTIDRPVFQVCAGLKGLGQPRTWPPQTNTSYDTMAKKEPAGPTHGTAQHNLHITD